ncbi:hypothetical protein GpartN1_g2926.t1 [Galdieria partita]|uniref:Uncharacterized protein n=1 Tax=Galdieria partita TaxID=83374 RepID=A0A9C7PV94_9RHOD|nr:hypothetical protein GpartN1_g2926.t1 [Galdieria partita]
METAFVFVYGNSGPSSRRQSFLKCIHCRKWIMQLAPKRSYDKYIPPPPGFQKLKDYYPRQNYPGTLAPGITPDILTVEELLESPTENLACVEYDMDERAPFVRARDDCILDWLVEDGRLIEEDWDMDDRSSFVESVDTIGDATIMDDEKVLAEYLGEADPSEDEYYLEELES